MTRLFRRPEARLRGYAALGLFIAAYVAALALVLSPEPARQAEATRTPLSP